MKRTPMLVAILAASAIAFGSAGTAGAHDLASASRDGCAAQGAQTTDGGADTTCETVGQAPPVDETLKPDVPTGTDGQGAMPLVQTGADAQGPTQLGQTGTDAQGATPVAQTGTDDQTMPNPDEGAKPSIQSGADGQTMPASEPAAKDLGQSSADDQMIQMPASDASD
jgi:hypothetical protein